MRSCGSRTRALLKLTMIGRNLVAPTGLGLAALALLVLLPGCDAYDRSLLKRAVSQEESQDAAADELPYVSECGNGQLDDDEECDTALEVGTDGACPSTCSSEDPCFLVVLVGSGCQTGCFGLRTTKPNNDDGCCPADVGPGEDSDCDVCGNGIVGPSETCDPPETCRARASCDPPSACLLGTFSGSSKTCTSACSLELVNDCIDGDGCCPAGCDALADDDCSASCGNDVVEGSETCEVGDPAHPCPVSCDDAVACTIDLTTGSPENCNVECTHIDIVTPTNGDGCCPPGAHALNDSDCAPTCGNEVREGAETCDPCGASCDDSNVCTVDASSGSPGDCSYTCSHTAITQPQGGDSCCPSGANANDDSDCAPDCGNDVRESGETCDPCPGNCSDGNSCTTDQTSGSAGSCTLVCAHTAITQPANGDGCCPSGANSTNDSDCSASCGNHIVEAGEACDGGGLCRNCALIFNSALVHRYAFDGSGSTVTDSVGTAHGTAINSTVGGGVIDLSSAATGNYVDLPDGLISSLSAVTFEIWIKWDGGSPRQRAFDFGNKSGSYATSFIMLETKSSGGDLSVYANFTSAAGDSSNDYVVERSGGLDTTTTHHLAVTFGGSSLKLYVDGVLKGTTSVSGKSLSQIDDKNDWLGRSQFASDPELDGAIHEFRIYSKALSASEIQTSYNAGENP
jgi:hypothetical protein